MNIKFLCLVFAFLGMVYQSTAQDLIRKVPAESNFLATINSKAVFKHLDIDHVDSTLNRVSFFKTIFNTTNIEKLEDTGVDFNAKAYIYSLTTDSVQFVGALIPLTNIQQFESIVTKDRKIQTVNGMQTVYSGDGTLRLSWDTHTAYVLGGIAIDRFFKDEEVQSRYNLPEDPYKSDYNYNYNYNDDVIEGAADSAWSDYDDEYYDSLATAAADEAQAAVDSVAEIVEMMEDADTISTQDTAVITTVVPPPLYPYDEDYDVVDEVLTAPEYQDDYYLEYRAYTQGVDSIKNVLIRQWVDDKLQQVIQGKVESYRFHKGFKELNDHALADIKVRNFDALYKAYLPDMDVYKELFGINPSFSYGIEELSGRIEVIGNKLQVAADVTVDDELASYYKQMYKQKINPKFLPFLNKDLVGFMSLNVNTEKYIKYFPSIMNKYYGPMAGKYSNIMDFVGTLLDVVLDEKAIAKVMKGDNLLVFNGITSMDVEYTDYEYDDDYNYTEVKKTKKETIPQFLWMFSSADMRIFEKLINIGLQEDVVKNLEGGLYEIDKGRESNPIQPYVLLKNGIVFVGNDLEQLEQIKKNTYSTKGHPAYIKMAKKNNFAVVFNTKKVPQLVQDLELPVASSMESTIHDLSRYGDFYITSSGMKGNKLIGEVGLEVPNSASNALEFLFNIFDRWTIDYETKKHEESVVPAPTVEEIAIPMGS